VTNRNYFDQRTYAIALAQSQDVDMSLILLQNAIRVTSLTKPAILPPSAQLFTNQAVTACGLGIENQQLNLVSSYLQFTKLKVLANVDAAKYYGDKSVDENVMCTAGNSETGNELASTCSGEKLI
jgi:Trypsin